MFTSQSEHRLLLRHDNADERLMAVGRRLGLVPEEEHARWRDIRGSIAAERRRLEATRIHLEAGSPWGSGSALLSDLLKRPDVTYGDFHPWIEDPLPAEHARRLEIDVKYEGYIARERRALHRQEAMEERVIPSSLWDTELRGVSHEGREALRRVRPGNVGQAGRVRGVSPADIGVLLVRLEEHRPREVRAR